MMDAALTWYQNSAVASAVGNSPTITAVLSAFHALGFTFVMGGAIFANAYIRNLQITNNVIEHNGGTFGAIRIGTPNLAFTG